MTADRNSSPAEAEMVFTIGDRVEKFTGDYQLPGEVRSSFTTRAGKVRFVVEHDPGFLHIYGRQNLRLLTPAPKATETPGLREATVEDRGRDLWSAVGEFLANNTRITGHERQLLERRRDEFCDAVNLPLAALSATPQPVAAPDDPNLWHFWNEKARWLAVKLDAERAAHEQTKRQWGVDLKLAAKLDRQFAETIAERDAERAEVARLRKVLEEAKENNPVFAQEERASRLGKMLREGAAARSSREEGSEMTGDIMTPPGPRYGGSATTPEGEACPAVVELRSALREALSVIDEYIAYEHDGNPDTEDAREHNEMEINRYERDGRLDAAKALLTCSEPTAWRDVLAERRRQVEVEGWSAEHDDRQHPCALSSAAACYALADPNNTVKPPSMLWPWDATAWKPRDERSNLVRAGALILADIERLGRAAAQSEEGK
ncbi:hypothetical protein [Aureimonas pseudogalii]|uniref:Uncharacterized protein n=1 Tax=Aureimonas pseudogalii TaxID=1744844 RepID=A0A7W6EC14_9HYPH|nr:hypothetical protein [Aureimonas pseudogalii]MBB3997256.1 hypothetical protein [Aureimonas pseudogalii]